MEKITVNTDAREKEVLAEAKICLDKIQSNAKSGIEVTELMVPINIAGDVRFHIENELEKSKTSFTFLTVKVGNNQYTGKIENFSGMNVGDNRLYKVKIF